MSEQGKQPGISIGFVSLGCAKNLVDSQVMAGTLLKDGLSLARSPEEADVVIVNTCAFIEDAREESVAHILDVCDLKKSGRCKAVLVAGCLPQRYGKDLQESLPEVDAFIGLDALDRVGKIVKQIVGQQQTLYQVSPHARALFEPVVPGLVFTGGPFAYLKIAEGCNHGCSFCAIPGIRGAYRSRPVKGILQEADSLLAQGIRELNLISQDLVSYGKDLKGHGRQKASRLPELLRALGERDGSFWIRLLYGYVSGIRDDLLDAMNDVPQVCPYLDIPIQHSHPDILKGMGRASTAGRLRGIVTHIRERLPQVVLRTTCLVGFPGEKEKHFRHLLEFIEWAEFDHVGVFVYSPEENTKAYDLPGRPLRKTAEKRRDRLLLAQQAIADRKHAALVDTSDRFLLETRSSEDPDVWIGRSRRQAPEVDGQTWIQGVPRKKKAGDFVRARYTGQAEYDMLAVAGKNAGKRGTGKE